MKRTETEIQRAICDYLKIKGHFFTRVNNVPIYDPRAKRRRALPKYTIKGFPDILVLLDGVAIGIEVKSETGKISSDQKEFKERWLSAGGSYFIARSVKDVMDRGL